MVNHATMNKMAKINKLLLSCFMTIMTNIQIQKGTICNCDYCQCKMLLNNSLLYSDNPSDGCTCYICNTSRRNLPDMHTRALGYAAPEGKCGYVRQIPTTHVTYVTQHSQHCKNLPNLLFAVLPLYIMMGAIYGNGFSSLTFV